MRQGNLSNVKGVGEGVLEYRIDWGPGYRIYLGRDGETVIILLGGGSKEGPAERHRSGQEVLERLSKTQE
jgi:putative addiction module killer protein